MALTPAGLDPVKPQVLHPRLALPNLIRCQTSLKSLIYGANFRNYVRVTDSVSPILGLWQELKVSVGRHQAFELFKPVEEDS